MIDTIEKMSKRIDEYFEKLTPQQLQEDLDKAGYSFYKKIKTRLLEFPLASECCIFPNFVGAINIEQEITFEEFSVADRYGYKYQVAA